MSENEAALTGARFELLCGVPYLSIPCRQAVLDGKPIAQPTALALARNNEARSEGRLSQDGAGIMMLYVAVQLAIRTNLDG